MYAGAHHCGLTCQSANPGKEKSKKKRKREKLEDVKTTFPEPDCMISLNVSTTFVPRAAMALCNGRELARVGGVESVLNWYEVPLMPAKN